MSLESLIAQVRALHDAHGRLPPHTPRHLAAALSTEAGELQKVLLWQDDAEVAAFLATREGHGRLSDEVADVLIYALLFAHAAGIDPEAAVRIRLERSGGRFLPGAHGDG